MPNLSTSTRTFESDTFPPLTLAKSRTNKVNLRKTKPKLSSLVVTVTVLFYISNLQDFNRLKVDPTLTVEETLGWHTILFNKTTTSHTLGLLGRRWGPPVLSDTKPVSMATRPS